MLCMALLLCAALLAEALTNEDFLGTWYLNEVSTGGANFDPSIINMETVMEISADGTATITNTTNGTIVYTWKPDGEAILMSLAENPEYAMLYELRDDGLFVKSSDISMLFGRERIISEGYQPSDKAASASLSDFCGDWEAYYMYLQGAVLPFAITGMTVELTIGENKASAAITDNGETTKLDYSLSFADNALTLTDVNNTEDEFSTMQLALLADGNLICESEEGNIYFRLLSALADKSEAGFAEALEYFDAEEYEKAFPLLKALAEAGNGEAAAYLGKCYEIGYATEIGMARALELYKAAADAGNASAQSNLAILYYNGTGVEKDMQKARELFELSAAQGNENAIAILARYFGTSQSAE